MRKLYKYYYLSLSYF